MIFPLLTVEENLQVGFAALPKDQRRLPEQVFEYFPALERMLKRRGGDLSGGQQQQLAIARALVLNPRLLILDEPTEGLQPNIVNEIGEIVVRLKRELGMTVLVVEQKLHFVRSVSDAFFIMTKGSIVAEGPMSVAGRPIDRGASAGMSAVPKAAETGWRAHLRLSFAHDGTRTVIGERAHEGPLYVQRPFYPESAVCHAYILHPPAGMVGGDRLETNVRVAAGASALITTPASAKGLSVGGPGGGNPSKSDGRSERHIRVATPGHDPVWRQQRHGGDRAIQLAESARFMGWELLSLGRPLSGDRYRTGDLRQRTLIRVDNAPRLIERQDWRSRRCPAAGGLGPWRQGRARGVLHLSCWNRPVAGTGACLHRPQPGYECTSRPPCSTTCWWSARWERTPRPCARPWQRSGPNSATPHCDKPGCTPRIWAT